MNGITPYSFAAPAVRPSAAARPALAASTAAPLTAAEEAERKSEQVKVYSNISELALYFSERKLTWLSHHFFDRALAIASESK